MRRRIAGVTLMAGLLATGVSAPASAAPSAQTPDRLTSGQFLVPDERLVGPSHLAAMQGDGNFVVYGPTGAPRFSTGTSRVGSSAIMQGDGNFVVYGPDGAVLFNTQTHGNAGAQIIMQGDGNLVVYAANGSALWSTFTGRINAAPPTTPDTLGSDGTLSPGQRLVSGDNIAAMQGDGNFVVYSSGRVVFSTGTSGQPGARAVMQSDGNFVIYSAGNKPLFNTGTGGRGPSRAVVQNDGNFVVYSSTRATWSSKAGRIPPPTVPGDGSFLTPSQVGVGIYQSPGLRAGSFGCYWETDDAAGNIIANQFTQGQATMTVTSEARTVETQGCMPFVQV